MGLTIVQNEEQEVEVFNDEGDLVFLWNKDSDGDQIACDLDTLLNHAGVAGVKFMRASEYYKEEG